MNISSIPQREESGLNEESLYIYQITSCWLLIMTFYYQAIILQSNYK